MNAAYLHIALVHVPVVLTPVSVILLAIAHLRSSLVVARVALGILIAASLVAVCAYFLGEGAEEIVEHLPGILESTIENHEESASLSLGFTIAVGLLSLMSWVAISRGSALERVLLAITFMVAAASSASLAYTAHLGGIIRHPEIVSSPDQES
jgi:hypothetical protein